MTSKYVPIGPGVEGLAVGLAWGRARKANAENAALEAELEATRERLLRVAAAGEANLALANGIVDELKDVKAGRISNAERRLSDPDNRAARVAYATKVEDETLNRISNGRLRRK